jgi:hypothetical protein
MSSAFSSVKRFVKGLFSSGKNSPSTRSAKSSSVSKRRYGSPRPVPPSKKSVTRTSAERKKNRSNLINRLARAKREETRRARNAQPSMVFGQVGRRHNTGEPFHMPINRFNNNMGSLRSLHKKHRNPANIVRQIQSHEARESLRRRGLV